MLTTSRLLIATLAIFLALSASRHSNWASLGPGSAEARNVAQAPGYHVTILAAGPGFAHPGDQVSYRLDVTVEGGTDTDVAVLWTNAEYVSGRLISGGGNLVGEPQAGSAHGIARWTLRAPAASIAITLRVQQDAEGKTVRVSGYVPGTETGSFTTARDAITQVLPSSVALPATGGSPAAGGRTLGPLALGAAGLGLGIAVLIGLQLVKPRRRQRQSNAASSEHLER